MALRCRVFIILLFAGTFGMGCYAQEDNVKKASDAVTNVCNSPEFSYEDRKRMGYEQFMALLNAVHTNGDEGDTELVARAYEALASTFVTFDAVEKRDEMNRRIQSVMDLNTPVDFNLFLYMSASYFESADEDVDAEAAAFSYSGDAALGLKFMSDVSAKVSSLGKYDQARYYAVLGCLQVFGRQFDEARATLAKASSLVASEYGDDSPEYLLFRMFEELPPAYGKDFSSALSLAQQTEASLRGYSKDLTNLGTTVKGVDFLDYSSLLSRMATYCKMLSRPQDELKYNESALESSYDNYGSGKYILAPYQSLSLPPSVLQVFLGRSTFYIKREVASNYYDSDRKSESRSMYKELLKDYRESANSASNFTSLDVGKIKSLMEPLTVLAPLCAHLFPEDADIQTLAYDCTLQYKNFSLYADNLIRKLVSVEKDPDIKDTYNETVNLRKRIVDDPANSQKYCEELSQMNNYLLVSLDFSKYGNLMNVSWGDVQSALPQKSVAVEFMQCTEKGNTIYMANILSSAGVPHIVELCTEQQLKDIRDIYNTAEAFNLLWKPVISNIADATDIYFSPSGMLYNTGIEYLLCDDGKTMNEKYSMHRLSSTREIAGHRNESDAHEYVIYGGVRYGTDDTDIQGNDSRSGLHYLPQTLDEMNNVDKILNAKGVKVDKFSEFGATEESFKRLSGTPINILHIATHGFYWTERNAKRMKLPFLVKGKNRTNEDKAMSRSGLFLANANDVFQGRKIENKEDGVLTSSEIAQVDLDRINLVVLSACQTALGEIDDDGVYGLQRGFKKAGAHSILMSLWKVDDEATQILMTQFYTHLMKGEKYSDALNNAQQYLRKAKDGKFKDPYYWAAFILLDAC